MNLLNILYINSCCVHIVDVYYGLGYVYTIIRLIFVSTFSGSVFLNSHIIGYALVQEVLSNNTHCPFHSTNTLAHTHTHTHTHSLT
jgi:hypothetical protein